MKSKFLILIILGITISACNLGKDKTTERPNILFIMSDDHASLYSA